MSQQFHAYSISEAAAAAAAAVAAVNESSSSNNNNNTKDNDPMEIDPVALTSVTEQPQNNDNNSLPQDQNDKPHHHPPAPQPEEEERHLHTSHHHHTPIPHHNHHHAPPHHHHPHQTHPHPHHPIPPPHHHIQHDHHYHHAHHHPHHHHPGAPHMMQQMGNHHHHHPSAVSEEEQHLAAAAHAVATAAAASSIMPTNTTTAAAVAATASDDSPPPGNTAAETTTQYQHSRRRLPFQQPRQHSGTQHSDAAAAGKESEEEEEENNNNETDAVGAAAAATASTTSVVTSKKPGSAPPNKVDWMEQYKALEKYKEKYGNCMVPMQYPPNPVLGKWVNRLRAKYQVYLKDQQQAQQHGDPALSKHRSSATAGTSHPHHNPNALVITPDKIDLLNELGFEWVVGAGKGGRPLRQKSWMERYAELQAYRKAFGHCRVPKEWKENPALGQWVAHQRQHYRKFTAKQPGHCGMNEDRIALLNELDFCWNPGRWPGPGGGGGETSSTTKKKAAGGSGAKRRARSSSGSAGSASGPKSKKKKTTQQGDDEDNDNDNDDQGEARKDQEMEVPDADAVDGAKKEDENQDTEGKDINDPNKKARTEVSATDGDDNDNKDSSKSDDNDNKKKEDDADKKNDDQVGDDMKGTTEDATTGDANNAKSKAAEGAKDASNPPTIKTESAAPIDKAAAGLVAMSQAVPADDDNATEPPAGQRKGKRKMQPYVKVDWTVRLDQLKEFKAIYGHSNVPLIFPPNKSLGYWVKTQRQRYKNYMENPACGGITPERIALLEDMGFLWKAPRNNKPFDYNDTVAARKAKDESKGPGVVDKQEEEKDEKGEKPTESEEKDPLQKPEEAAEGNPKAASKDDEKSKDETEKDASKAAESKTPVTETGQDDVTVKQEADKGNEKGSPNSKETPKDSEEKENSGDDAAKENDDAKGDSGKINEALVNKSAQEWSDKFAELSAYKKKHGNCLVPLDFGENKALGQWVGQQRYSFHLGNMDPKRHQMLEDLGFVWAVLEEDNNATMKTGDDADGKQETYDSKPPSSDDLEAIQAKKQLPDAPVVVYEGPPLKDGKGWFEGDVWPSGWVEQHWKRPPLSSDSVEGKGDGELQDHPIVDVFWYPPHVPSKHRETKQNCLRSMDEVRRYLDAVGAGRNPEQAYDDATSGLDVGESMRV